MKPFYRNYIWALSVSHPNASFLGSLAANAGPVTPRGAAAHITLIVNSCHRVTSHRLLNLPRMFLCSVTRREPEVAGSRREWGARPCFPSAAHLLRSACESREGPARLPVTWRDPSSGSSSHILIGLIVDFESVAARAGCDICKSPAMFGPS